jgi:hypothetical protein
MGRLSLCLLFVDKLLVEKSLTFVWEWDYEVVREEKKNGADVSFKYWEKGGLEVGLTYFGTYLVRKMFTLNFLK